MEGEAHYIMARGWESKSVESQIESAQSKRGPEMPRLTIEQAAHLREQESLLLSKTRVLHDLDAARNPRYREILKAGLADLERRITELK